MKKIKLKNFKAFESEIELKNPQAKNILLFGENGSGKSSIYEALRYVFYQEEIEKVDTLLPLPDQRAKIDSIRSDLTNQHSALPFSIELNGKSVGSFPKTDYQVFMLTRFDKSKSLGLALLLDNGNIPISDKKKFLSENWEIIKDNVNVELRDCFSEPLSIEIGDERSRYPVTIINTDTGLSRVSDLDKYFNEAAINLVQLLIWFSAVQLAIDPAKKN